MISSSIRKKAEMKRQNFAERIGPALMILFLAVLNCDIPPFLPAPNVSTEVYVSVQGSDSPGNGTQARPYRHVQYAIDHTPSGGRINLARGIYQENLFITHALTIHGVAATGSATPLPNDPLMPVDEVSVIVRQNPDSGPGILVQAAGEVQLDNLVVLGGGMRAVGTRFTLSYVEVRETVGEYGVRAEHCGFLTIAHSKIMTGSDLNSDLGIDVIASPATIQYVYVGGRFDHAITIKPFDPALPHDPYAYFEAPVVTIWWSEIAGSPVDIADGIRIQGPAKVSIVNNTIIRSNPDDQPVAPGTTHAAINIGGWLIQGNQPYIEVDNNTISGFDTGIFTAQGGFDLRVRNSSISGVRYDVYVTRDGPEDVPQPRIDFGSLDMERGRNVFGLNATYSFYNNAPYNVYACNDIWLVPDDQVAGRIYDQANDPSKGRVMWKVCE
jgi:hypothetical protein